MAQKRKLTAKQKITLEDYGKRLALEVSAAETVRDGLTARWDTLWRMFRNEKGASGISVLEDLPAEHVPLIQPIVRRIVDSTVASVFGVSPVVSAIGCKDDDCADVLAKQYDSFLAMHDARRVFRQCVECAAITGVSALYHPFDASGWHFHAVMPENFFITPIVAVDVPTSVMCGHQYWMTEAEYLKGVEDGRFYDWGPLPYGAPDGAQISRAQDFNMTTGEIGTVEMGTKQSTKTFTIIQAFWYGDFEDLEKMTGTSEEPEEREEGPKWWRFLLEKNSRRVLQFEPYPYDPPYSVVRLHDEPTNFWPASSAANSLQSLQNSYSQFHNILQAGAYIGAFPAVVVSGGKVAEKVKKLKIGAILESDVPIEMQPVPSLFNGEAVLAAISKIEELAQTIASVTPVGVNNDMPTNTTATEVNALTSMQAQSESAYAIFVSYTLERLVKYMHAVCQAHEATLVDIYGEQLEPHFVEALRETPRFEALGKTVTRASQYQMQQYIALYQMASDPRSGLKKNELVKRIVGVMDLDATDELFYDEAELAQLGLPQVPGVGALPGMGAAGAAGVGEATGDAGADGGLGSGQPAPFAGQGPGLGLALG